MNRWYCTLQDERSCGVNSEGHVGLAPIITLRAEGTERPRASCTFGNLRDEVDAGVTKTTAAKEVQRSSPDPCSSRRHRNSGSSFAT